MYTIAQVPTQSNSPIFDCHRNSCKNVGLNFFKNFEDFQFPIRRENPIQARSSIHAKVENPLNYINPLKFYLLMQIIFH